MARGNGSIGSANIIRFCGRSIILRTGGRRGANRGIEEAQCEFILFWDDDMLLAPADGLRILADELLRHGGDMIAPASCAAEDAPPGLPRPTDAAGELLASEVLLNRWTLMRRGLPGAALPSRRSNLRFFAD